MPLAFTQEDCLVSFFIPQTDVDNVISAAQIAENYIQANGSQLITDVSAKFTCFRNFSSSLDYLCQNI